MCKTNSPDQNKTETNPECLRQSPQIRKRSQHGTFKTNSPDKNEANTGCVSETSEIKKGS